MGAGEKVLQGVIRMRDEASRVMLQVRDATTNLGNETVTTTRSQDGLNSTIGKLGGIIATAFAVDKVIDFGKSVVEETARLNAMDAQFEQIFKGVEGDIALKRITTAERDLGIHTDRLTESFNKFGAQVKGAGMDAKKAMSATDKATRLAADSAAFYDVSLETSSASLASFMKGNFEAGDAIGVFTNATQMNNKSLDMYNKKWQDLNESERQWLLLDTVEKTYKLNGAMGQAAREADQYENVMGNLKATWNEFKQLIGQPILNFALQSMQGLISVIQTSSKKIMVFGKEWANIGKQIGSVNIKGVIDSIAGAVGLLVGTILKVAKVALPPMIKAFSWIISNGKAIAAVFVTVKSAAIMTSAINSIGKLKIAFIAAQAAALNFANGHLATGAITGLQTVVGLLTGKLTLHAAATNLSALAATKLKVAMTALGGPIGVAMLAISALVVGVIYLWNTNEGFRNGVIASWNNIKQVATQTWGYIANFFTQTIPQALSSAGQWFDQLWNNIKQSFSNGISAITGFVDSTKQNIVNKFEAICIGIQAAFVNGINSIQNFFTQTIPAVIDNVVAWFEQLPYRLGDIIGFAIGRTIAFGIEIHNFFTQTIPQVVNNIVNWFKELPSKLAEQFNLIVTNVTTWGVNFYTAATSVARKVVDTIVFLYIGLPIKMATYFNMIVQNVITWGINFYTSARNGAVNAVNVIVNYMAQLPGKVKAKFNQVISAATAWATSFAAKGKEGATKFATRLYDELKKIPGKVKKFGKDIVDGILNGIRNAINGASNAFKSFGQGIVNGIKRGLGINSPSRLARDEIGVHIPTGIAVGVAKAIPTAVRMINKSMAKMMGDVDTPEAEMNIGVSTSNSSNTGVSTSQVNTQQSGSVSASRNKGDINIYFNIDGLTVREETDIRKIAKELVKELKLSDEGGVVYGY